MVCVQQAEAQSAAGPSLAGLRLPTPIEARATAVARRCIPSSPACPFPAILMLGGAIVGSLALEPLPGRLAP